MMRELSPAIFLDRDGTLMLEADYCSDPQQVSVFPGVRESLARLKAAGFKLVIITNQSGIGRGYFTVSEFEKVQAELLRQIGGDFIDAVYFCPDAPDSSDSLTAKSSRRKPSPAMVLEAANDHRLDLARSYFIGDKMIDVECGRRAGTRGILLKTGYGAKIAISEISEAGAPDFVADDLAAAADWILSQPKTSS